MIMKMENIPEAMIDSILTSLSCRWI